MKAARCAFVLIALAVAGCPLAAAGASSTDVFVRVMFGKAPQRGAVCHLRNPLLHAQRITDAEGTAKFDAVGAGKYALECDAAGYEPLRSELRVRDEDVELHVDLRLELHEIGRVAARPPAATIARTVTRGAPLGKLSQNLYDMMNRVGGANVLTDATGSLVGVSLEGRDPRMTSYGFDGTRIPEPGALRALDADLLQSAQLNDDKTEADFYTLAPTTFPEYTYQRTLGGFGAGTTQLGARGSVGSIGYVLQGTVRTQASALNNATYLDTSGLSYKHVGAFHGNGLLAKVSAPLNDNFTVTAETLLRRSTMLPVDAFYAGPLPSGTGPGNVVSSSSALTKVQLEGEIGHWQTKFNATTIRTKQNFDYRNRIVSMTPLPYESERDFRLDILDASLIDFIAEGKTLNLNVALSRAASNVTTASAGFGNAFASYRTDERPAQRVEAVYVRRPNKYSQESIGVTAEARGGRTAAYVEGAASFGGNGRRVFGTLGFGGRAVPSTELQTFDDPAAALYDCAGNAIRVRAPNDPATNVRERHVRIGGLREGSRGSISVQAYDTLDAGATATNADTPLSAFPLSALPPDFASQLLQGYRSFGACSTSGAAPAIYLLRDVTGLVVEYRGVELTGSWKPSKPLTLQGSVRAHQALLRSHSSALLAPDSPYIVNGQLPAVEPFDVSLTADYGLRDGRSELIANAIYKPRNNANGLPAYWLLTLGGTRKLSPTSSLTVVATNALHSYVDSFASVRYAVPLQTVSGGDLLLPASPLVQPQLFVTLNVKVAHEKP